MTPTIVGTAEIYADVIVREAGNGCLPKYLVGAPLILAIYPKKKLLVFHTGVGKTKYGFAIKSVEDVKRKKNKKHPYNCIRIKTRNGDNILMEGPPSEHESIVKDVKKLIEGKAETGQASNRKATMKDLDVLKTDIFSILSDNLLKTNSMIGKRDGTSATNSDKGNVAKKVKLEPVSPVSYHLSVENH